MSKLIQIVFAILLLSSCKEVVVEENVLSCGTDATSDISVYLDRYSDGCPINIAVVGDSTSMGFGANAGPNVWGNGISYMFTNLPELGPNFDPSSIYYLGVDFPYISQEHQDNIDIPSAVRLLRTEVESRNAESKVYNYGGSGWVAATHIQYDTVSVISELDPKPQIVIINLGINSAKNNQSQKDALSILVEQFLSYDIIPVLVKPNNIAVTFTPDGDWSELVSPDDWVPMDNWPEIRQEIDDVAAEYGLQLIDLGSDDGVIDPTILYDPFHPNAKGYERIYSIYSSWLN